VKSVSHAADGALRRRLGVASVTLAHQPQRHEVVSHLPRVPGVLKGLRAGTSIVVLLAPQAKCAAEQGHAHIL
jgi:hypothetical protein